MRLWHKDLIPYLPRQQLLGQWRECCLIAKTIKETGTPNHILVNRIMNYSLNHFWSYGTEVAAELIRRGYEVNENKFTQYFDNQTLMRISHEFIFKEWHDEEYLTICYYNLLEKYKCGGIPREEFEPIYTNLLEKYMHGSMQQEEFKPIYILKTGGKMNESTSGN